MKTSTFFKEKNGLNYHDPSQSKRSNLIMDESEANPLCQMHLRFKEYRTWEGSRPHQLEEFAKIYKIVHAIYEKIKKYTPNIANELDEINKLTLIQEKNLGHTPYFIHRNSLITALSDQKYLFEVITYYFSDWIPHQLEELKNDRKQLARFNQVKEAADLLKNPENVDKPLDVPGIKMPGFLQF